MAEFSSPIYSAAGVQVIGVYDDADVLTGPDDPKDFACRLIRLEIKARNPGKVRRMFALNNSIVMDRDKDFTPSKAEYHFTWSVGE